MGIKYFFERVEQDLFRGEYPDIVSVVIQNFSDGVIYNVHKHEYAELIFILEGKSEQQINQQKYSVKKGDLIILNKGALHSESSGTDEPAKVITCVLDNVHLRGLADNQIVPDGFKPVVDCKKYYTEIVNIFRELYDESAENKHFSYELAQLNVAKIIFYIYRMLNELPKEQRSNQSELSMMIKAYLDENYNRAVSLKELADEFHVTSYHIVHEMKKEIGLAPINYLINRRIGEAQRYLLYSDKHIKEISEMVGYENISYFNRLFVKKTGCTAAKFRELYMAGKELPSEYFQLRNLLRMKNDDD